ncbi:DUF2511 domain-containing protein [Marmoricola sp. RAF53]|uniref:DUF2511 domain-containing protein n=1 Tax=Marmoricola sp. RAF53 TaxID=3233059 RepID=UPI003F9B1011
MTKTMYGKRWPLTVPSIEVRCINDAVIARSDGVTYAVNGTAMTESGVNGWKKNIRPLWAAPAHPDFPGQRIDLSPIIDYGLSQCGDN